MPKLKEATTEHIESLIKDINSLKQTEEQAIKHLVNEYMLKKGYMTMEEWVEIINNRNQF